MEYSVISGNYTLYSIINGICISKHLSTTAEHLRTVNNLMIDNIATSIVDCIRENFYHVTKHKQKPFLHTTTDKWMDTTQP